MSVPQFSSSATGNAKLEVMGYFSDLSKSGSQLSMFDLLYWQNKKDHRMPPNVGRTSGLRVWSQNRDDQEIR
jgi:hypothetical protein